MHNRYNYLFYNNKQIDTSKVLLTGGHARIPGAAWLPTMFTSAGGHGSLFPIPFPPLLRRTARNTAMARALSLPGALALLMHLPVQATGTGRADSLQDLQRPEQP